MCYFLGFLICGCACGAICVPCIYPHARWSYRRRFRSLLLCPLSVEYYQLTPFCYFLTCTIRDLDKQFARFTQWTTEVSNTSIVLILQETMLHNNDWDWQSEKHWQCKHCLHLLRVSFTRHNSVQYRTKRSKHISRFITGEKYTVFQSFYKGRTVGI